MPDFHSDCVAFITGAGSGIGRAVAERLAGDGVTKIVIIDLNLSALADTTASLSSLSPSTQTLAIGADCSKEAEVEDTVRQTVEKFGRIDVCFNAAGISGANGKIADTKTETMEGVLGLNLKGVWFCERAEIRQMISQEKREVTTGLPLKTRGAIVNVGSLTTHIGLNGHSPYVMAKHAMLGLCKADTVDYAEQGIRINCICPGWIKTPMTKFVWDGPLGPKMAARAPINRWGLPEEVAYTVSYLLSDKASFVTGTDIVVDGGYLCQ